jgi:hypothetical protein
MGQNPVAFSFWDFIDEIALPTKRAIALSFI